jgi:predicted DsbA family dithiol-disulfide isomerase
VSPRTRPSQTASVVLYEDPLSPWCVVAERRIEAALDAVDGFGSLRIEPFPNRVEPRAMSKTERSALVRSARLAAKEPEAAGTTPDLWLSDDAPLSSVPALTALAAARLQGVTREVALRNAIREAGLVRGIDVSRPDVLLELAERSGLDLARFAGAFHAPATERRVREAREEAMDKGVREAPALVIGDEWLVSGVRPVEQYRSVLREYLGSRLGVAPLRTLH